MIIYKVVYTYAILHKADLWNAESATPTRAFLNIRRFSNDLILFRIGSQTFGASYDKDSLHGTLFIISGGESVSDADIVTGRCI